MCEIITRNGIIPIGDPAECTEPEISCSEALQGQHEIGTEELKAQITSPDLKMVLEICNKHFPAETVTEDIITADKEKLKQQNKIFFTIGELWEHLNPEERKVLQRSNGF